MFLIPIAWLYVALMMSVAEATSPVGSVLGAVFTFVLYGLLPVGLLMYIMGTPGRKRAIREREVEQQIAAGPPQDASAQPDASGLPPGDPVPPVGKEP
jgi:hypothetical protein